MPKKGKAKPSIGATMATLTLTGLGWSDACLNFTPEEAAMLVLVELLEPNQLEMD